MSDIDTNSSNGSTDSSNDSLNGSWVKLDASFKNGSDHPVSAHNGEMEDLLAEAVDESKAVGTSSDKEGLDQTTPSEIDAKEISSETKVLPLEQVSSDLSWIENWSSRIEPHPPKKWRLTYPPQRDPTSCTGKILADKSNTNFITLNFYIVIPTLLITHLVAFGIGLYLGRRSSSGSTPV